MDENVPSIDLESIPKTPSKSNSKLAIDRVSIDCQTETNVCDAQIQTSEFGTSNILTDFHLNFTLKTVSGLISILIDSIPDFTSTHLRILNMIIYMILRISRMPLSV
jgi:hypothetical protein